MRLIVTSLMSLLAQPLPAVPGPDAARNLADFDFANVVAVATPSGRFYL